MRAIREPAPSTREVGIHPHEDGTVTVVVRTGSKRAAATIPLTDLIDALTTERTSS